MLSWVIKAPLMLICSQKHIYLFYSSDKYKIIFSVRIFSVQHVYLQGSWSADMPKMSLKEELTCMTLFRDNFRSVRRIKKCSRCCHNSHLLNQTSRRFLQAAKPRLNQFLFWFLSAQILCFPRSSKSLLRLLLLLHQKKRAIHHARIERRKT